MSAAVPASLTVQLITVSIITLQRQISHNLLANRNQWNSSYDYVVVGAGSAGSVVAARLSENPNFSVLLVEAGGPESVITDMPANWIRVPFIPEYNWNYWTTAQTNAALAFRDRALFMPRGRIMGGSGSINALAYNRGNRRDYDGWARNYGARGWTWDEVLPYFMRSENMTDPSIVAANPGFHGTRGPLELSTVRDADPIMVRILRALQSSGSPYHDMNANNQIGSMFHQQTIATNGVRATTATSFLRPIFQSRANLHIISRSLVTKILTRRTVDSRIEAYGVSFTRDGGEYTVSARREVILSAGVFNSPQLLMLSGIGPADHLRQFGIPVVADLPVGDNLMDHLRMQLFYIVNNASEVTTSLALSVSNLYEYYTHGSGPLSRFPTVLTYLSSALNNYHDWPDGLVNTFVTPIGNNMSKLTNRFIAERIPQWNAYFEPLVRNSDRLVSFNVILGRPRSRGTVRLRSRDPTAAPIIDPNHYLDAHDLAVHIDQIGQIVDLVNSHHFRPLLTPKLLPIPGCDTCGPTIPLSSCYSYITCCAQSLVASDDHSCGTCRMGSATDPRAVLDERLLVRGVSRLRVIDASVMPEIPNANPLAATIMVAEKGSDLVKQDY